MAKYAGLVGYATQEETTPGVWTQVITERMMRGDVIGQGYNFTPADKVNDNIGLSHRISLVADPYAYNHVSKLVYVTYLGQKWKVSSVEINRPRLTLTLGGVWNG